MAGSILALLYAPQSVRQPHGQIPNFIEDELEEAGEVDQNEAIMMEEKQSIYEAKQKDKRQRRDQVRDTKEDEKRK